MLQPRDNVTYRRRRLQPATWPRCRYANAKAACLTPPPESNIYSVRGSIRPVITMFLLRPSSIRIIGPSQTAASGTEEQLIPAEIETPAGPDLGSPIPDAYDIDFLRVLVQDPFSLYIYWELRQPTVDALTKVFPKEEFPEFQIVLRLIEITERHESFFNVGRIGSYWMSVFAGKKYRFEIGVRSPRRGYIKLIGSNEADTPRGTVAPESDRIPRFRLNL